MKKKKVTIGIISAATIAASALLRVKSNRNYNNWLRFVGLRKEWASDNKEEKCQN